MSLPTDYGIEMKLLLKSDGGWGGVYTYYNHGLEPPWGGVRSEAADEAEGTVDQFESLLNAADLWINYIRKLFDHPLKHNPDLPLTYKLKIQDDGDLKLKIEMETLDSEMLWNKATGNIEFHARPAYDLSWEGFLYYKIILEDFLAKIKEQ